MLPRLPPGSPPRFELSAPGTRLVFTGLRIVKTGTREIKGKSVASEEEFEQLVADALDEIPPELGREMDNVAVVVEEWPTPRQLGSVGAGGTLLGLYEGIPITKRGPISYVGVAPDRITIFRGPLTLPGA